MQRGAPPAIHGRFTLRIGLGERLDDIGVTPTRTRVVNRQPPKGIGPLHRIHGDAEQHVHHVQRRIVAGRKVQRGESALPALLRRGAHLVGAVRAEPVADGLPAGLGLAAALLVVVVLGGPGAGAKDVEEHDIGDGFVAVRQAFFAVGIDTEETLGEALGLFGVAQIFMIEGLLPGLLQAFAQAIRKVRAVFQGVHLGISLKGSRQTTLESSYCRETGYYRQGAQ